MGSDYLPITGQRLQCLFRLHTLLSCWRRCLSLAYCRVSYIIISSLLCLFRKYNPSSNALITVTSDWHSNGDCIWKGAKNYKEVFCLSNWCTNRLL